MGRGPLELSPFGSPTQRKTLGLTSISEPEFLEELANLLPRYGDSNYDILTNNCTHFCNTCCGILLDKTIPSDVANQSWLIQSLPFGALIKPSLVEYVKALAGKSIRLFDADGALSQEEMRLAETLAHPKQGVADTDVNDFISQFSEAMDELQEPPVP